MNHTLRAAAFTLLALLFAGCGGESPSDESSADSATDTAQHAAPAADEPANVPAEPAAAPAEPTFALTAADVTAYEHGLRREIELLRAARERLRQAGSDDQRLEILGEIQPRELRREGAAAAGTSEARYTQITSAINDVLGKREMAAASQQMMPSAAELERMPPEQRAQVEENLRQMQAAWGDPYAGLAQPAVDAIEQRVDELARLRADHIALLAQPM